MHQQAIVREALRLMGERDQMLALHKGDIRRKIAAGMASLRAGEGRTRVESWRSTKNSPYNGADLA